jgi:sugar lactone lactonase YvrE
MNSVWSATRNRALLLALLGCLPLLTGCASSAREKAPAASAVDIVWPMPPDPPRVRFVEALDSDRDVKGRTKRNLKEILFGIDPERLAVRLARPMAITSDSRGRILVTDHGNPGIHVYDLPHHDFSLYGAQGEGAVSWPTGIAVDGEDNIYVSDHKRLTVLKYDRDGKFLYKIGTFENPVGLAVDKGRGLLFVVDSQKHQVQVFTLDGKPRAVVGERGSAEGQFNYPTYCAVDAAGSLYVVDTGNSRVQVFDKNFEVVGAFGSLGTSAGQFTRPKGIAVDKRGIIYVADAAFNNIQMFDREFRLLLVIGESGFDHGKFRLPSGLWVDDNDRLYVADYANARIQILQFLSESLKDEDLGKKK